MFSIWTNRYRDPLQHSPSSPITSSTHSSSHEIKHCEIPNSLKSPSSTAHVDLIHSTPSTPSSSSSINDPHQPHDQQDLLRELSHDTDDNDSSSSSQHTLNHDTCEKARKAGKYLQLLLHCQRCNGECNNPVLCKHAKLLYGHSSRCKFTQCPIVGCPQTKKLLQHFTYCRWARKNARLCGNEIKECLMCSYIGYDDTHSLPIGSHSRRSPDDHHHLDQLPVSPETTTLEEQEEESESERKQHQQEHDQQRQNGGGNDVFEVPLPPKRLRVNHSMTGQHHYIHHIQHLSRPRHSNQQEREKGVEEEEEDENEDCHSPSPSPGRKRSVSHAPNFNQLTRSTRTGSI
jgi:hypothetical protein